MGRENKYKYIFTPVLLGRENKFKFIFTPVYWGDKINLNLIFPDHYRRGRKIYFKQWLVAWLIFLLVWGVIFISNRKMTLATQKGETTQRVSLKGERNRTHPNANERVQTQPNANERVRTQTNANERARTQSTKYTRLWRLVTLEVTRFLNLMPLNRQRNITW